MTCNKIKSSDMGHIHFLYSTCDIEENKQQRDATLPFLKMDMRHWGPPFRAPDLAQEEGAHPHSVSFAVNLLMKSQRNQIHKTSYKCQLQTGNISFNSPINSRASKQTQIGQMTSQQNPRWLLPDLKQG